MKRIVKGGFEKCMRKPTCEQRFARSVIGAEESVADVVGEGAKGRRRARVHVHGGPSKPNLWPKASRKTRRATGR